MEVEYLRELRQNYLMIHGDEHQGQGYEARMMIGNTIEGLLKFRIKKADNQCRFCYEITSKQPLSRMLEKKAVNAEQIRKLLLGIARTLTRMEDYLLTEEQILLDPDYIYVDPEEYQPFLCLLPGKKGNFPEEFSLFLQFLLGKTDHEDKEAVVLIYGLYRESLKENYGLDNLLRWLMKGNYPDMEYYDKTEKCEKMDRENAKLWENEETTLQETESNSKKTIKPEKTYRQEDYQAGQVKVSGTYFLPGIAMLLLAAGIRFFSGRYGLARYGICLTAAGLALLAAGAILCCYKFFSARKCRKVSSFNQISHDLSSFNPSINNPNSQANLHASDSGRVIAHESLADVFGDCECMPPAGQRNFTGNLHAPDCGRATTHESLACAFGIPECILPVRRRTFKEKTPAQPGQWQMVFEEPEEENAEEIPMAEDFHEEEMRTVLLWNQSGEKAARSLVSLDGESDILLSYYPFIIGKQEGLCDYVLDKSTVSRLHVRIDETETGYQATDLNSTNGTFVNGKPLDANGTVPLQPGDDICVADLRFQFK